MLCNKDHLIEKFLKIHIINLQNTGTQPIKSDVKIHASYGEKIFMVHLKYFSKKPKIAMHMVQTETVAPGKTGEFGECSSSFNRPNLLLRISTT